jgi:hypothetical protein
VRHRLQVVRVDTPRCPTEMVELQPIGDRAAKELVGEAVGIVAWASTRSESAVPLVVERRGPEPAWTQVWAVLGHWASRIHLGPEALVDELIGQGSLAVPPARVLPIDPGRSEFPRSSADRAGERHDNGQNVCTGAWQPARSH